MTTRGYGIALIGVLAATAGLLLRWPEFIAIGVGLLCLLLVPVTLRRPQTADWSDIAVPVRVVRGDPAALVIDVTIGQGSLRWVSAVDDDQVDRVFLHAESPKRFNSEGSSSLTWLIDTSRRGSMLVGPTRLETGDPFGIANRVLATRAPSPVLVVPRVHAIDAGALIAASDHGDSGERAGSETFQSLREYVVGDPMKLVHWRSSARTGTMMVRRMVDTTVPWLLVVLDVNTRAYDHEGALFEDFDSDAFEQTVDTAASWAWHGCTTQQRVLLTTTAVDHAQPVLAAEVTLRSRESALDALALVDPIGPDQCGAGRISALVRRQGVGSIVLVTGRRRETSARWVSTWGRQRPVTVVAGHS